MVLQRGARPEVQHQVVGVERLELLDQPRPRLCARVGRVERVHRAGDEAQVLDAGRCGERLDAGDPSSPRRTAFPAAG